MSGDNGGAQSEVRHARPTDVIGALSNATLSSIGPEARETWASLEERWGTDLYFATMEGRGSDNPDDPYALTALQSAILLGVGAKQLTVDEVAAALGLPASQVLGLFAQVVLRLWK